MFLAVDIDECTQNNGSCDQICVNVDGSYFCDCEVGYQLVNGSCQGDLSLVRQLNSTIESYYIYRHINWGVYLA